MSAVLDSQPAFEPMEASELTQVARMEATLCDFPWSWLNFSDSLAAGYSCWVLRISGELVGYAVMMLVLDEAHLLNIGIAKSMQGQGWGRQLLLHLKQVARRHGARRMFLEVRPSNHAARWLYDHDGFQAIGRRPGYYQALTGREDAIVMSAEL